ncbi:MAG: FkbM family methyltransferase [Deltaproteobacteria bacterium]|jgi:FkbM family methyltransferase|nr:FkbM family methyltransferase [Deltaproteobacteria bacterium]
MSLYKLSKWIYEQRYLHRSIRETFAKIITPGFREGYSFRTDFFEMLWLGKTNNYVDYQVLLRGAYEKFMLFFMRDALDSIGQDKVVLDIGANIGNHALFLTQYASIVHAFENYQPAKESLEEKMLVNNIGNIVIHPIGLSDRKESIPFYPQDVDSISTGSFEKGFCGSEENAIILNVDIGDDVMKNENITGIDLIKIDVEGFEIQVLKGLANTMRENRPLVIFETLPATRESSETDFEKMKALFPDKYSFYIFSRRDKKRGKYRLARIQSTASLSSNDIIACPDEKAAALFKQN